MYWERVCNTWQLITADGYGFYLVPDKHDKSLYNVYMTFDFCNMQLLSEYAMELNEAKDMAEAIATKFKTLK